MALTSISNMTTVLFTILFLYYIYNPLNVSSSDKPHLLLRQDHWSGMPSWCDWLIQDPQKGNENECKRRPSTNETCSDGSLKFFSQHYQDLFLYHHHFQFFKRPGIYLDIAANDAVKLSNTFFLDRCLGWKGICWEANPRYFADLYDHRSCHLVPTCASNKREILEFQMNGAYGGVAETNKNKQYNKSDYRGNPIQIRKLECLSVQIVLDRLKIDHIDFLSLDVEGHELSVLEGIDFNRTAIDVITIERGDRSMVDSFLQRMGYAEVHLKGIPGDPSAEYRYDSLYVAENVTLNYHSLST